MVQWPKDTPPDVRCLADQLAAVLEGRSGQVAGPAIALTFAFVIAELGGFRDDEETVRAIVRDVGALARRYGALNSPTLN
jgi:hypothetical protein